jgi:GT2 family glycosyltransferase
LELQLATLQQHPEAGVAYSWTNFMYEKKGVRSFHPGEPVFFEGNILAALLVNNFIASGSNVLIRREAIESVGEFDSTLKNCQDWDYLLRLAHCWPFVLVPKHQILYRRYSGSMSSKAEKMKKACLVVIEKAYRAAPQSLHHLKKKSLAWIYRYCTEVYLRNSTDIQGIQQGGWNLYMAICLQPKTLLEEHTQNLIRWFLKRWILMKFAFLENYWGWD